MLKVVSKHLWIFINNPEGPHLKSRDRLQATVTSLQRKKKDSSVTHIYSVHSVETKQMTKEKRDKRQTLNYSKRTEITRREVGGGKHVMKIKEDPC